MSVRDYLADFTRRAAIRRKRVYGIEPPQKIADFLACEQPGKHSLKNAHLISFILFHSPGRRLRLLWRYLTDRDTEMKKQWIRLLGQDLKLRLSPNCRIYTGYFERRNCSRDLAYVPSLMEKILFRTTPYAVVQPVTEQDVSQVLAFCFERGVPVFPRGSASFAFGGAVPTRNGLVLDLSPWMDIVEIDAEKRMVRVQPGARWADVASRLEPYGLIPTTTPTSRFSTVAGWICTGGMGLDSFAFGPVYESVLSVRVVRPDGRVEFLKKDSRSIKDLSGTEGQFGVITEIALRVRPKPDHSGACLLTFDTSEEAVRFLLSLGKSDYLPSHAAFFDASYMKKENRLFSDHKGVEERLVPERNAVLLHFESRDREESFLSSLNGGAARSAENRLAARFLWEERFFPLKAQRLGPGLLGAEVVVPGERLNRYLRAVKRITRHFGVRPAVEVILFREGDTPGFLVLASFGCDPSRSVHYILNLLLIQLLVRKAVLLGGFPYGIGIWNTPFVKSRFGGKRFHELRENKQKTDPRGTLNPHKFFKIEGRFFGLTSWFMKPLMFRGALFLSGLSIPLLGLLAKSRARHGEAVWAVPSREEEKGERLLRQSAQRCTSCGSCISACPAYHITRDELVVGRTKLRMAGWMIERRAGLSLREAHAVFQCLHCGLCEEVCQTRLPLRECYLALEMKLEERFGPPEETIRGFIQALDAGREIVRDVFGLDIPEWAPDDPPDKIPVVNSDSDGGGR